MIFDSLVSVLANELCNSWRTLPKKVPLAVTAVILLMISTAPTISSLSILKATLTPLPYPQPDLILRLEQIDHKAGTIPELLFWQQNSRLLEYVSAYRNPHQQLLTTKTDNEWISTIMIHSNFFKTLNVTLNGREFSVDEIRNGGPEAVILTYSLWHSRFNCDINILGKSLVLDGIPYTVVGVLPSSFWFPQPVQAFTPLKVGTSLVDTGANTQIIARLKRSSTLEMARREADNLAVRYADSLGVSSASGKYSGFRELRFQEWIIGDIQTSLVLVSLCVVSILGITCMNLAGLFLTNALGQHRDIVICMALGATPARVFLRFALEQVIITLLGCLFGFLLAIPMTKLFLVLSPFHIPTATPIVLHFTTLLFFEGISVLFPILLALVTVQAYRHPDLYANLRTGIGSVLAFKHQTLVRRSLVIAQIFLSTLLITLASASARRLNDFQQRSLGFDLYGSTFQVSIPMEQRRTSSKLQLLIDTLIARVQDKFGLSRLACTNLLPLSGNFNAPVEHLGNARQSLSGTEIRFISPEYFSIMNIRLVSGRAFKPTDSRSASPVVIVNESLARLWWDSKSPLGDRVIVGRSQGVDFIPFRDVPREIVGVVSNAERPHIQDRFQPAIYIPFNQISDGFAPFVTKVDCECATTSNMALQNVLRQILPQIDTRQRLVRIEGISTYVESTTSRPRFETWLFSTLAFVALAATLVGLYGVVSYTIARRSAEFGLRLALGSTRFRLLTLVLSDVFAMTTAGLLFGSLGGWILMRLTAAYWSLDASNKAAEVATAFVLLFIACHLAGAIPAIRTIKVCPSTSLRCE